MHAKEEYRDVCVSTSRVYGLQKIIAVQTQVLLLYLIYIYLKKRE
jgi:hypothetical protein